MKIERPSISTRGSMAYTLPLKVSPGKASTLISMSCPSCTVGRYFSGTLKSTLIGEMASRPTSGWPGVMYSPTLTWRSPTMPAKGAMSLRLVDLCLGQLDRGVRYGEIALGFVLRAAASEFAREQFADALIALRGELLLRLGLVQLGLIDRIVEGDEGRALLDLRAFGEINLLDAAGDLRADHHRLRPNGDCRLR